VRSNVDLKIINLFCGTCSFNGGVGALVVRVQNAGVAAEDVSVSFSLIKQALLFH
jgi:hypothetical protein